MLCFFFFNDTATTEIYTLSLHDALPISAGLRRIRPPNGSNRPGPGRRPGRGGAPAGLRRHRFASRAGRPSTDRSEEHTSELQSQSNLVCRLLLEKKKKRYHIPYAKRTLV